MPNSEIFTGARVVLKDDPRRTFIVEHTDAESAIVTDELRPNFPSARVSLEALDLALGVSTSPEEIRRRGDLLYRALDRLRPVDFEPRVVNLARSIILGTTRGSAESRQDRTIRRLETALEVDGPEGLIDEILDMHDRATAKQRELRGDDAPPRRRTS